MLSSLSVYLLPYCKFQKWTNLELGSLLRCNYQLIHNELLLHLSTHYDQVFSGLATLALKSGKESGARIRHTEDMVHNSILSFFK